MFRKILESLRLFDPRRLSISTKLLIALFCVSTIPMGLIAYNDLRIGLDNLVQNEYFQLEIAALSSANRLEQLIIGNRLTVSQVARKATVVDYLAGDSLNTNQLSSKAQKSLDIIFRSSPNYDAVFILDKDGVCRVSTDLAFLGQNYSFRDYFKQAIKGQGTVPVSLLKGATSGRYGLFFAHPIRNHRGETLGVAVLKTETTALWDAIDSTKVNSHLQAFLIDEYGIAIAHHNKSLLYRSLDSLPQNVRSKLKTERYSGKEKSLPESLQLPTLAEKMVGAKQMGHTSYYSPIEETEQMVGFVPLETEPWVLGVNKPKALFKAPMRVLIWENIFFTTLVAAITSIVSLLLSRQLGQSIMILTKAGKAMHRGNFTPEMLTKISKSRDDLGTLARVFLTMAKKVKDREQNLKSQVKHLQVEINNSKKEQQLAEITGTEYFQNLQKKARRLKNNAKNRDESEYFQDLQKKVQRQKTRFIANLK